MWYLKQKEVIERALETEKDLVSEAPGSKSSKDTTKVCHSNSYIRLLDQSQVKIQLRYVTVIAT